MLSVYFQSMKFCFPLQFSICPLPACAQEIYCTNFLFHTVGTYNTQETFSNDPLSFTYKRGHSLVAKVEWHQGVFFQCSAYVLN